ncbi:P-loop containing nucleoside triphosphate hydrolase protein [Hypoxylon sp. FL0543]|nr:P-loop containing nucleoside triphosphate hydrolase protein [Hypoxylon sp. FL0543]
MESEIRTQASRKDWEAGFTEPNACRERRSRFQISQQYYVRAYKLAAETPSAEECNEMIKKAVSKEIETIQVQPWTEPETWKALSDTISRIKKKNKDRLIERRRLRAVYESQIRGAKTLYCEGINTIRKGPDINVARPEIMGEVEQHQPDITQVEPGISLRRSHQDIGLLDLEPREAEQNSVDGRTLLSERLRELEREKVSVEREKEALQLDLQIARKEFEDARRELQEIRTESDGHIAALGLNLTTKEGEVESLIQELELARKQEKAQIEQLGRQFDMKLANLTQSSGKEIQNLVEKLARGENARRALFTQVQKLRGAFRVMCRIRPDSSGDRLNYTTGKGEFHDHPAKLTVSIESKEMRGSSTWSNTYEFERVFTPKETNEDVFSEISEFVQMAIDGKKACVFCYGQSGTGKTYTMSNRENAENANEDQDYKHDGIIPKVKAMIFREKSRLEELSYDMSVEGCCYEIYNNEVTSLTVDGHKKIVSTGTRAFKEHDGFETLKSASDFDALIKMVTKNRRSGSTKLNDTSSRSHLIVRLKIKVRPVGSSDVMREGLLNLIDLSGSEGPRQAGTTGVAFQEGTSINTSLSSLARVFEALVDGRKPTYSNNTLTKFLQDSLGSDCMTLMLLMISPLKSNWPSTKHTLEFARTVQSAKKPGPPSKNNKVGIAKSPSTKSPRAHRNINSKR